ncbi:MAG: hypothetical protein H7288_05100, partial [Kineosporiaceae bacterium]|nr:hypothetical protein [Aeromicrobium sp.]
MRENADRRQVWQQDYAALGRVRDRRTDRAREAALATYGLTWEDEIRVVAEQGGGCGVCGDLPDRAYDIDHDHVTGAFRGFLCGRCNKGLGLLGDSIEGLRKALLYLERAQQ